MVSLAQEHWLFVYAEYYNFTQGTRIKLRSRSIHTQLLREVKVGQKYVFMPKNLGHDCEFAFYDPNSKPKEKDFYACSRI